MNSFEILKFLIDLLAVLLLALGIKGLSKVRSAREANRLAAMAMALAAVGVFVDSFIVQEVQEEESVRSTLFLVLLREQLL